MPRVGHRAALRGGIATLGAAAVLAAACSAFDADSETQDPGDAAVGVDADASGPALDAADRADASDAADANDANDANILECDPAAAFGLPALIPSLENNVQETFGASLTDDELGVVFAVSYPGLNWQVAATQRTALNAAFTRPPTTIDLQLDTPNVSLGRDGKTLFVAGKNDGGVDYTLRSSSHNGTLYEPAIAVDFVADGGLQDFRTPFVSVDGTLFFYARAPRGLPNGRNLFVAPFDQGKVTGPGVEVPVNSLAAEYAPVLSADGLTLYFASERADGSGKGKFNIWRANRTSKMGTIGPPTEVAELNSDGDDVPSWLSHDGCRLYMSRKAVAANSKWQILVATKAPTPKK